MSETGHPSEQQLALFLRGDLARDRALKVAAHLLTGCQLCQNQIQAEWTAMDNNPVPRMGWAREQSSEPLRWADRLQIERENAPALAAELSNGPLGRSLVMASNLSRFQTWGIAESLCELAYSKRFDDVHELIDLSTLAVAICAQLDESVYGSQPVADLSARAWSHLGNGHSILADFPTAQECFDHADRCLQRGTGDPLELADSLRLRVGLRLRQARYDEARAICIEVRDLYTNLEDHHRIGLSWLLQGTVAQRCDSIDDATDCYAKALEFIDPAADPATPLTVRHNLTLLLHQTGRNQEAQLHAREALRLYQEAGDRQGYLQFRRVQAAVSAAAGLPHVAEQCLLEARNGFIATGMAARAAVATLELAQLYLDQENYVETRRIAEQLLPILQVRGLHEEALAALLVFREAAMKEELTNTLLNETLNLVQERHADA